MVVILVCWQWRHQLHNSLKFLIFSKGGWLAFCNLCCSFVVQRWETNWAWMFAKIYCSICTIHDLVHIFNINKITTILLVTPNVFIHWLPSRSKTSWSWSQRSLPWTTLIILTIAHIDGKLVNLKQKWNVIASSFSYTLKTTKRQPDWNHYCCYFMYVVLWTPKLLMSLILWRQVKTCN